MKIPLDQGSNPCSPTFNMKRVFIIHGWGGSPEEGWFPWLKKELEKNNFLVEVVVMPDSFHPTITAWVSQLAKRVKQLDKNTYFVGHSIGCQTILRYLETQTNRAKGIILVAPWMNLDEQTIREEGEESVVIAKPWIETPINFKKIKTITVAIFSDNDPYVPLDNTKIFEKELQAKIIIEKRKGHFSGSDNVKKIPAVLKELLRIERL